MRGQGLSFGAPAEVYPAPAVTGPLPAPRTFRGRFAPFCILLCLIFVLAPFQPRQPGHSQRTEVSGEQVICLTSARAETEPRFLPTPDCCLPPAHPELHACPADPREVLSFSGCRLWLLHFRESMRHILRM